MRKLPRTLYLVFVFLILFSSSLFAQEVVPFSYDSLALELEIITTADGLSQSLVNDFEFDDDGFLWLATKDGLNRYNGNEFQIFRHREGDPYSLGGIHIKRITIDSKKRMWVSVLNEGISLFRPQHNNFISFNKSHGLLSNNVLLVQPTPNGELILSFVNFPKNTTEVQVLIPGEKNWNDLSIEPLEAYFPGLAPYLLPPNQKEIPSDIGKSTHMQLDANGVFWCMTSEKQLLAFSHKALKGEQPAQTFEEWGVVPEGFVPHDFVFNHTGNDIYVFDKHMQFLKYHGDKKSFLPWFKFPDPGNDVPVPIFDLEGRVLIQYSDSAITRFNIKTKSATVLLTDKPMRLSKETRFDDLGNLWNCSYSEFGLTKINAKHDLFRTYSGSKNGEFNNGIIINDTWAFRVERPGKKAVYDPKIQNLLTNSVNTAFINAHQMQRNHFQRHQVQNDKGEFILSYRNKQENHIALNSDPPEPKPAGVWAFDPSSQESYRVVKEMNLGAGFFDLTGHYWADSISESEASLFRMGLSKGEYEKYTFPIHVEDGHYRFLSDWWAGNDGLIWLATINGLFTLDPERGIWNTYTTQEGVPNSLSHNTTLSVCADPVNPERYMWIGTEGGGLNRFDREKQSFTHFTIEDGLPNNVIYGILADDHEHLWLSTNFGLCQFNAATFACTNYTVADGINGNEFNRYQFSKADDGTMCFGGVNGITVFHPDRFYEKGSPSNLVISGLRLINKPIDYDHQKDPSQNDFELLAPIEITDSLVFQHSQQMITFEFALLDLTTPENNQYRYRLEGFDKEWIHSGFISEATYTNLNPGKYTFKVAGLNSQHVWSTPKSIHLTILPPWWATWWFRILLVIVSLAMIYSFYRYRLAQMMRLERMRNRIAQDLHDEIGSTLSSIALYSAVMQKSPEKFSPRNNDILNKIISNTSGMMEQMNDLVWTLKSDNDFLYQVINRMRAFGVTMAEAKEIRLYFHSEETLEEIKLTMEQRKNIFLIYKEAINNAVKYSHCKTLKVIIQKKPKQIHMKIQDDGIGYDVDKENGSSGSLGGNGLSNMKYRANALKAHLNIESSIGNGTIVELFIPINH